MDERIGAPCDAAGQAQLESQAGGSRVAQEPSLKQLEPHRETRRQTPRSPPCRSPPWQITNRQRFPSDVPWRVGVPRTLPCLRDSDHVLRGYL